MKELSRNLVPVVRAGVATRLRVHRSELKVSFHEYLAYGALVRSISCMYGGRMRYAVVFEYRDTEPPGEPQNVTEMNDFYAEILRA